MDAARQVLERLDRIEALTAAKAGRAELLEELRALVREGEAWVAVEAAGTERAQRALAQVSERLPPGVVPQRAAL
jgi:hypothetical protein